MRLLALCTFLTICGYASTPCDIAQNGVTNLNDVQTVIKQALGQSGASADMNVDGVVNVVDVQIVMQAALTGFCGTSVTGTASLGAAIAGAGVTLVDSTGQTVTASTASDGTYRVSSAGLTPPYLVRIVTASASGSFPPGTTLYSVSADGNANARINVHVLSDLMVRSFYSAQGLDADIAFANPTGSSAPPTPAAVQSLASVVIPGVQLWLNNAGVNATPGPPANGAINLISSPFTAYPAGVTPTAGLTPCCILRV